MNSTTETPRNPIVFLTHASADAPVASEVARALQRAQIGIRLDVQDVTLGGNFVQFMARSMDESDYCVTLWSKNVKMDSFIGEEIAAAYVRSIHEKRVFLILALADEFPVPMLFRSRVFIQLFPDLQPGLQSLAAMLKRDAEVKLSTGKGLVPSPPERPEPSLDAIEVYICSAVFDRTLVFKADPRRTGAALITDIAQTLRIPATFDYEGRVGVRLHYHLRGPNGRLAAEVPLADQAVPKQSVLWLEVEVEVFAAGTRVANGPSGNPVYRGLRTRAGAVSERNKQRALETAAATITRSLLDTGVRRDSEVRPDLLERMLRH